MSAPQPDRRRRHQHWERPTPLGHIPQLDIPLLGLETGYLPSIQPEYTYSKSLDGERLQTLLVAVHRLMLDGQWRSLGEIRAIVGHSEAGISARLRQIRSSDAELKPRPRPLRPETAVWVVERRRRGDPKSGLFEYRLIGLTR